MTRHRLIFHCILMSEIRQHAWRIVQVTEQYLPNSPFQFLRRNAQAGDITVDIFGLALSQQAVRYIVAIASRSLAGMGR